MEAFEFKREFMKDHSSIIKKSLDIAVDQMLEGEILDLDTYQLIKDAKVTDEDFHSYLESKPAYRKTDEEIKFEMDNIKENLDSRFTEVGLDFMETESIVDRELFIATKKFLIDKEFTMSYFGVPESDAIALMKRKGFVEKFVVLRFVAIFSDFEIEPNPHFKSIISGAYSFEEEVYGIDIHFEIELDEVESQDNLDKIVENIKETVDESITLFNKKMGLD